MPSSVIRSFAYDADHQHLDIEFVSGKRYRYIDVPARLVTALEAAASKGHFFNTKIRDRFAFTRRRRD